VKDLQNLGCREGRDYRSEKHYADGPKKAIWGKDKNGLVQKKTVLESDATFKVVLAPYKPIVCPDRGKEK